MCGRGPSPTAPCRRPRRRGAEVHIGSNSSARLRADSSASPAWVDLQAAPWCWLRPRVALRSPSAPVRLANSRTLARRRPPAEPAGPSCGRVRAPLPTLVARRPFNARMLHAPRTSCFSRAAASTSSTMPFLIARAICGLWSRAASSSHRTSCRCCVHTCSLASESTLCEPSRSILRCSRPDGTLSNFGICFDGERRSSRCSASVGTWVPPPRARSAQGFADGVDLDETASGS